MAALNRPWLSDFCRLPRIAAVLAIAELVVVIIALAPSGSAGWTAREFASASALSLWLALTLAVVYCKNRPWLNQLPMPLGIVVSLLLPLTIAAFIAWALQQINSAFNSLSLPKDDPWHFIGSVSGLAVLITALTLRYFYVRDQWQAQVNANAKAEVDALQARIRPHFLFNSMNTIAALVRRDPILAERAVEDLSELFRAALGAGEGSSTLAEEIYLAERYLAIETLRLGERLRVDWVIAADAPKDLRMPRLVLQPLVENAVLHGISLLLEGGVIAITIFRDAQQLTIRLLNPAPAPRENANSNNNGHAQESIAQRLAYHFGPKARMTARFHEGHYECILLLPLP